MEICITSPIRNYSISTNTTVTVTATQASMAAPISTDAASGSTTDCGLWYEAQPGDYCNLIIVRDGISLADFLILDPEVNENCTNLYAEESNCVEPVGDTGDTCSSLEAQFSITDAEFHA
ncbi:hypothetical protein BX600DRAFT_428641 [Xylariales sp. PMI_506]|nr:hypothetical protein BX600DRAFT_428641 [Xylariales sp. PMI_506]